MSTHLSVRWSNYLLSFESRWWSLVELTHNPPSYCPVVSDKMSFFMTWQLGIEIETGNPKAEFWNFGPCQLNDGFSFFLFFVYFCLFWRSRLNKLKRSFCFFLHTICVSQSTGEIKWLCLIPFLVPWGFTEIVFGLNISLDLKSIIMSRGKPFCFECCELFYLI